MKQPFPVIDPVATGENILRLRKERGMSIRDLQEWFQFEEPRAIYKWQKGQTLPSVDNLVALSAILGVPMEGILVVVPVQIHNSEPQKCGSEHFWKDSPAPSAAPFGLRGGIGQQPAVDAGEAALFAHGPVGPGVEADALRQRLHAVPFALDGAERALGRGIGMVSHGTNLLLDRASVPQDGAERPLRRQNGMAMPSSVQKRSW